MSRIRQAFENKKAFIGFVTGGDPDLETTEKLVVAMEEAGADLIEIGIPFSDPIAEGVVIQEANIRDLSAGCTTDKLFDAVKRVREKVTVPMVFLTYINPIYTYGKEKFMQRLTWKKAEINRHMDMLNDQGQQEAVRQVELLTKIPDYRKDAPD